MALLLLIRQINVGRKEITGINDRYPSAQFNNILVVLRQKSMQAEKYIHITGMKCNVSNLSRHYLSCIHIFNRIERSIACHCRYAY